jgi:hypothetical protein
MAKKNTVTSTTICGAVFSKQVAKAMVMVLEEAITKMNSNWDGELTPSRKRYLQGLEEKLRQASEVAGIVTDIIQ